MQGRKGQFINKGHLVTDSERRLIKALALFWREKEEGKEK